MSFEESLAELERRVDREARHAEEILRSFFTPAPPPPPEGLPPYR